MKPLADILDEFIQHRRSLNFSESTVYTTANQVGHFLDWLDGAYSVRTPDRLRSRHLHAYQHRLHNHRTADGRPLTAGTINAYIKPVRGFLAFLHRRGHTPKNLIDHLVYVKEPTNLPTSVLEHAEVRKLLNGIDVRTPRGYRDRTILEVFYSCGLRIGEMAALGVHDVNLAGAVLTVIGKGRKQRVVPVGKTALRCLETYIKAVRPFWINSRRTDALFLNRFGRRLQVQGLGAIFRKHRGERSDVTAHTMRRSCATELVRAEANLYHVKQLLGHESLDTLQPYTKLTINDLKKTHAKYHPREKDQ